MWISIYDVYSFEDLYYLSQEGKGKSCRKVSFIDEKVVYRRKMEPNSDPSPSKGQGQT